MLVAGSAPPWAGIAHYVEAFPYNPVVFLLTPWEEIYATDSERDQTFEEAIKVLKRVKRWTFRVTLWNSACRLFCSV